MAEKDLAAPPALGKRRLPRALKIALAAVSALIVLPIVALVIVAFTVDLGGVVKRQIEVMRPGWEQQIGRKIEVGKVSVRLFPRIAVELHDAVVQAAPGQTGDAAQPLFQVGKVRVGVAAWPLLTSLGKDVQASLIEVDEPQITVVRFADGKLSYEDVLDRLAAPDKPKSPPLTPDQLAYIDGVKLARLAILGARLHFRDLAAASGGAAGGLVTIDQLDIVASDVRVGAPFNVTVDAAVMAVARNFHLGLEVGPIPPDLDVERPLLLLRRAELKIEPIEVEPLLKFLPPSTGALSLGRAKIDADMKVELPAAQSKLLLRGQAGAAGLQLQKAEKNGTVERGQPADVRLKTDVAIDPLGGDVLAKELDISVNGMSVGGTADLRSLWTTPSVHALAIASKGLTLEGLTAILPPSSLPKNTTLRGPIAIKANGTGTPDKADVELSVDGSGATLLLPTLHKPAGTALLVGFKGLVQSSGIAIERLSLVLGPLSLTLHGRFHGASDLDLQLDGGKVDLDPLLRLLPTVAQSVPKGETLSGHLTIAGSVKRHGSQTDAVAKIALRDANAKAPSLTLVGGADLAATVRLSKTDAAVDADLDLTPARIMVPGEVDKAAGVPMRLKLLADRAGTKMTIKEARLSLPGGTVEAMGDADTAAHRMDLRVPSCELDLGLLAKVVPLLKKSVPPALAEGKLKFAMEVTGDPDKLSTGRAKISQFDLAASGTRLSGTAEVVGLDEPKTASFDLKADALDLDKWLGPETPQKSETKKDSAPPVVPKVVKTLEAAGKLLVGRGVYHGIAFRNLRGELTLSHGKATFQVLQMDTFGGQVVATGSTVDFNPTQPKFALKTKLQKIDLAQVLAVKSPALASKLQGVGDLDIDVDGAGLTWQQIAPQLTGAVGMGILDGKFKAGSIGGAALGQVVSRVQSLSGQAQAAKETMSLKNLNGVFHLENGLLHTKRPLSLDTDEGSMSLDGAIGLDQVLALNGKMQISPHTLELISGGKLKMSGPLPVDLRLGGPLTSPHVEVVNLEKTVLALTSQLVAGQGKEMLQKAIGGQLGGKVGDVAGQVLQQGNLDAAKAEAQKRADEERAKLQAEAQRRVQEEQKKLQDEAQKRVEDEAKKRLGGGLKGIFGN